MASTKTCKLLTLPAELRVKIYDHAFTTSSTAHDPLSVLLHISHDNSLRATCSFIYSESADIYDKASGTYGRACTVAMKRIAHELMKNPQSSNNLLLRGYGHKVAIKLLTGTVEWEKSFGCKHPCGRRTPAGCICLEHKHCFKCGRRLALAIYYDIHPEIGKPRMILSYSDRKLSLLGHSIHANTWSLIIGSKCEMSTELTERYPPMRDTETVRFGEYWWRFELEKQKMLCRSNLFSEEIARLAAQRSDPTSSSSDSGISESEKDYLMTEVRYLESWGVVLERNGLENVVDWASDIKLAKALLETRAKRLLIDGRKELR